GGRPSRRRVRGTVRDRAPRPGAHGMSRARVLLLAVASVLLAACGVQPDSTPRDVAEENQPQIGGQSSGGVASGAERIYLVGPGDDGLLRSVNRDADSPDELIHNLLLGPNEAESNAQFTSVIPSDLQL